MEAVDTHQYGRSLVIIMPIGREQSSRVLFLFVVSVFMSRWGRFFGDIVTQ